MNERILGPSTTLVMLAVSGKRIQKKEQQLHYFIMHKAVCYKRKPIIIGKAKHPHCPITAKCLIFDPVMHRDYYYNRNALIIPPMLQTTVKENGP